MSQVAGRMSVQAGATALEKAHGGRGVLLGGVPGVLPGKVAVIGGGVVGFNAAQMAVGLGADVTILDRDPEVLERLGIHFESRAKTRFSNKANLAESIAEADLVIGAVLIPGAAAPKLIRREHLALMKKGSVLVDISIDQGGCFETSRATTHADEAAETCAPDQQFVYRYGRASRRGARVDRDRLVRSLLNPEAALSLQEAEHV